MTTDDSMLPMTKADAKFLFQTMDGLYKEFPKLKEEILEEIGEKMATKEDLLAMEKSLIRHTGILIEKHEADFIRGSKDQLTLHGQQVAEIQHHVGLRS